jgi:hypothetical protein
MPSSTQTHFGDIINEIEDSVRDNLQRLNDWADQARDLLDEKPSTLISSLAIAGFMTGALLRKGDYRLSSLHQKRSLSDPLLVLALGAVAGWVFGPRIAAQGRTQPGSQSVSESRH